jgi:hypothetical protein
MKAGWLALSFFKTLFWGIYDKMMISYTYYNKKQARLASYCYRYVVPKI